MKLHRLVLRHIAAAWTEVLLGELKKRKKEDTEPPTLTSRYYDALLFFYFLSEYTYLSSLQSHQNRIAMKTPKMLELSQVKKRIHHKSSTYYVDVYTFTEHEKTYNEYLYMCAESSDN